VTRIPLILNPTAGGGRLLSHRGDLQAVAARHGAELNVRMPRSAEEATELARRAASNDTPVVLAYGGDGTYNAVARGLIGSQTALGVLPGGTTSVLAYEYSVPRPAARALAALLTGHDRPVRVGRSNQGDLILLMLSAGPDSHVLQRLRPFLKRFGGRSGIAIQALLELLASAPLPRMRVAFAGETHHVGWTIVGKSQCYGGRDRATPGADPFRADFELVAQRSFGRRAALAFVAGIPSGRHLRRPDVIRKVVDRVRLEPDPASQPVAYQVDGDLVGTLPVEVSIDPRPLVMRLPLSPSRDR
jgi:diacylglycerol kinase family enzyme